jgi:hypothetical protein
LGLLQESIGKRHTKRFSILPIDRFFQGRKKIQVQAYWRANTGHRGARALRGANETFTNYTLKEQVPLKNALMQR